MVLTLAVATLLLAVSGADPFVARLVQRHVASDWRAALERVSAFGDATGYVLATLVALSVIRLLARRRPAEADRLRAYARYGYLLLASLALSGLAVGVIKPLVGRLRPKFLLRQDLYGIRPLNFDFAMIGFPSGHSQTIWVVGTVLLILIAHLRQDLVGWRTPPGHPLRWLLSALAVLAVAGAALVALSRVLLNAHFVSDVLAGSLLGVTVTLWLAPRILEGRARPQPGQ